MNNEAFVNYAENALVISIPTKTPAELHKGLMNSIRVAIRTHLLNEEKTLKESQDMIYLINVQEALEAPTFNGVQLSQAI